MKTVLKIISFASLLLMFVASVGVFKGTLSRDVYLQLALVGTILWFVTVPFWMKRRLHQSE